MIVRAVAIAMGVASAGRDGVARQVAKRALRILEAEGLVRLAPAGLTPCDAKALARYGE